MKKIISFILVCCMLVSVSPMNVAADNTEYYREGWDVLKGLGIIHYDDLQINETVTRAEFAQVLSDAFHLVNDFVPPVGTSSFGRPEELTSFNDDEEIVELLFEDVSAEHENYEAIRAVTGYGIMKGNGDGTFEPDRVLKYEEAVKTLIVLCGYETEALVKGGWFLGYQKVANNHDLMLKDKAIGENLSKIEFAELVYRAFDIPLRDIAYIKDEVVYYEVDAGETFLSERLGFYCAEGQLIEAENSTITSVKGNIDDAVTVAGVTIKNKGISPNQYLGRYVKAYYTKKESVTSLVYVSLSGLDNVLEIDAEDFAGYSNGTISYFTGDTKRTVNVSGYPVIYNGAALSGYDASFLDDFYYGTITVTQHTEGTNVVNIRSFKNMVVSSVDDYNYVVTDADGGTRLSLNEEDYLVNIYNSGKEAIDFSKLNTNISISYLEGSNCREVYAGGAPITAAITAVSDGTRSFDVVLNNETKTFKTSKLLAQSGLGSYLNSTVLIYRNIYGDVFRLKSTGAANGLKQGVIAAVSDGSVFGDTKVKMFAEDGKFYEHYFADRILVYTSDSTEAKSVDSGDIDGTKALNGYRGYVTYSVNTSDRITEVRIPYQCNNAGKALKEDGDGRTINKKVETNNYLKRVVYDWVHIGYALALDASVKIFAVPSDPCDFEEYAVYNNQQLPSARSGYNTGYTYNGMIDAYFSDDIDPIPDAVIFHDFSLDTASDFQVANLAIVLDVWEELDAQGEQRTAARIYLTSDYGYYTVYSYPQKQFNGGNWLTTPPLGIYPPGSNEEEFKNIYAVSNNHSDKFSYDSADAEPIEEGDVILFLLQNGTYELANLIKLYDADKQNLTGGKVGYLPTAQTGTDKYFINWNSLPQTIKDSFANGEYDTIAQAIQNRDSLASGDDLRTQNPSLHHASYKKLVLKDNAYYDYGYRVELGYVVKNTDAFAFTTTQDLSIDGAVYAENGIPADFDTDIHGCGDSGCATRNRGIYLQRWHFFVQNNGGLTLLEFDESGNLNVRQGTPADIRSYEEYGKDASRVLSNLYNDRLIVINDYRSY